MILKLVIESGAETDIETGFESVLRPATEMASKSGTGDF